MPGLSDVAAVFLAALLPALAALAFKFLVLGRIGREPSGTDVFFYLLMADGARAGNHRMPDRFPLFLGSDRFFLPPLMAVLGSFVNRATLDRHHYLPSFLAKAGLAFITGVASGLTAATAVPGQVSLAVGATLVGGLAYVVAPINRHANPSNVSDFNFSPRPFAALLSGVACLTAVAAGAFHGVLLHAAAALLVALACLTAKFAVQAVVFILTLALPALFGLETWLVVPGGVGVAILLTRGGYWHSLVDQFRHLHYYARVMAPTHLPHVRSPLTSDSLARMAHNLLLGKMEAFRQELLYRDYTTRGLLLYPVHAMVGPILLFGGLPDGPWTTGLVGLWLASVVVWLLTGLPKLAFLGEADRYLEYVGFLPATILFSTWLATLSTERPMAAAGLTALVFTVFFLIAEIFPPIAVAAGAERSGVWNWLKAAGVSGARVVCVPVNLAYEIVYRTGVPTLYPLPWAQTKHDLWSRYPVPTMDLRMLNTRFGITHLLVDKGYLGDPAVSGAVAGFTVAYADEHFAVYAFAAQEEYAVPAVASDGAAP